MAEGNLITPHPENGNGTGEPASEGQPQLETRADDRGQKLNKRQRKLMKDKYRPLDSWERYRALGDVIDEQMDLVDLADHKARFALIIMGALNAFLFIIASNTDAFDAVPARFRLALSVYVLVYAMGTLYFFVQAIESLRPRRSHPPIDASPGAMRAQDQPLGLRYYEDVLNRDVNDYGAAWRDVNIGQLNAELAVQAHALAGINKPKYAALNRLYIGLKFTTLMAGLLLVIGAAFVLNSKENKLRLKSKKATLAAMFGNGKGDKSALGEVDTVIRGTVREPSGVVFDPKSGHLLVVGDHGDLAELDLEGKAIRQQTVEKQLEDVTVDTATGQIVLVSEKKSDLVFLDPTTWAEQRRVALDIKGLLGQDAQELNQGFEGLTFQPDPKRPGGGVFWLTHQRGPAVVVGVSFDPAQATRAGKESLVARFPVAGYEDLTGLTWSPQTSRLLVIAKKDRKLLVMTTAGHVETDVALPGKHQEGISADPDGNLWIADDDESGTVIRVDGGFENLARREAKQEEN